MEVTFAQAPFYGLSQESSMRIGSVVQSRPFDLLVFLFWSIWSHGPKRLGFLFLGPLGNRVGEVLDGFAASCQWQCDMWGMRWCSLRPGSDAASERCHGCGWKGLPLTSKRA